MDNLTSRNKPPALTIEQKIASGGFLDFRREFCPWVGICAVTGYKEIKAGRLKITKLGRSTKVAASDAIAYRDELRAASLSIAA
jgi:hypothetical protein